MISVPEQMITDSNTLLLPSTQHSTTLANHRVISIWQVQDEIMTICHLAYFDQLCSTHWFSASQQNILLDGQIEQDWFLSNYTNLLTKPRKIIFFDWTVVDEYSTLHSIIESLY